MLLTSTELICPFTRNKQSTISLIAFVSSTRTCTNARHVWRGITGCRCTARSV